MLSVDLKIDDGGGPVSRNESKRRSGGCEKRSGDYGSQGGSHGILGPGGW